IFSFLGPLDFDFIHDLVITFYPTINLHNYTLSGFSDVSNIFCSSATAIIAAHAYIPPIVALFWRSNKCVVEELWAVLVRCAPLVMLKLKAVCCMNDFSVPHLPQGVVHRKTRSKGIGFTITEFLIFPLNTFPAAMDPILVIFFIKPYQNRAKWIISQFFGTTNMGNSVSVVTVSSQISQF
uniref:Uncharacterized protein n=1 Tax=Caenorhabditis japonica TaxID=281687 RepID=A0A8R1DNA1_CAEJA